MAQEIVAKVYQNEHRPIISIESLHLQNFVTFTEQQLNFHHSFNCIIGETGSGKSLLFDALTFVLGGKIDKTFIRSGCSYSLVELTLTIQDEIRDEMLNKGFPCIDGHEDKLFIKRLIPTKGSVKNYLNNIACSTHDIETFVTQYIDIVGQFENQRLLRSEYQLNLIDQYANLENDLKSYQQKFYQWKTITQEIEELNLKNVDSADQIEFLKFQVTEFEKNNFSLTEEEQLLHKKQAILDLTKNHQIISSILNIIDGQEISLKVLCKELENLFCGLNGSTAQEMSIYQEKIRELYLSLEEASFKLQKGQAETDEEELMSILSRLDQYAQLKRKYKNVKLENIFQLIEQKKEELNFLLEIKNRLTDLSRKEEKIKHELHMMAQSLHQKRKKIKSQIETEMTKYFQLLNMKDALFVVELIENSHLNEYGHTSLNFLIQTNSGEGLFPLKKVASGGELSRILLALRTILSVKGHIAIFLFDEIDSGVGGKTAKQIGNLLKKISEQSQIIAITHLPQIAIYTDLLISVEKNQIEYNDSTRTQSQISLISHPSKETILEKLMPLD